MKTNKLYAVRDEEKGKLVSDLTNPRKKYWDKRCFAEEAIRKNIRYNPNLKLVVFKLVEVAEDTNVPNESEVDSCLHSMT